MSLLDTIFVSVRDLIRPAGAPVDQLTMFYSDRPHGKDFVPPFSVANAKQCPGIASAVEGETPFDYWVIIIDAFNSLDDEYNKDRSEFLVFDFGKFVSFGELLADEVYVPAKGGQLLRRYRFLKKLC